VCVANTWCLTCCYTAVYCCLSRYCVGMVVDQHCLMHTELMRAVSTPIILEMNLMRYYTTANIIMTNIAHTSSIAASSSDTCTPLQLKDICMVYKQCRSMCNRLLKVHTCSCIYDFSCTLALRFLYRFCQCDVSTIVLALHYSA
jgi:hypothetical protein